MKTRKTIALPISTHTSRVVEAHGIVSILDENLLGLIKTVRAAEQALRSQGVHLGAVDRFDGASLYIDAHVDQAADREKSSPSDDVKNRIAGLRANALRGLAPEAGKQQSSPPDPLGEKNASAGEECRPHRLASLLSQCPPLIEVDGEKIALGLPKKQWTQQPPPSQEPPCYFRVGVEEHLVSDEKKHYRCAEQCSIPALSPGETIALRVSRETRERIVNSDDLDVQIRLELKPKP